MTAIKNTMMTWHTPFISIDEKPLRQRRSSHWQKRARGRWEARLYTLLNALPITDWTHFECFASVPLATTCCTWLRLHLHLLCGCHWTTPTALSAIWVALDAWRLFKSRRQQAGNMSEGRRAMTRCKQLLHTRKGSRTKGPPLLPVLPLVCG